MTDRLQQRLEEIGAPDDVKALATVLAEQALRDPLTGLYNRRFFDEALAQHVEAARRYNRCLSLVLFDLDRFKKINDEVGHEAGDVALKTFARRLLQSLRKADIACRIGGDEFAAILPETPLSNVWKWTDRFFQILKHPPVRFPSPGKKESTGWTLCASVGAAALPSENVFADADVALLCEKRNRLAPE